MKSYKLIKTYPSSPEIGTIVIPKIGDGKPCDYYISRNWINPLDYPDFWEEVVELDYEILTVSPSEKHIAYYNKQLLFAWSMCDKDMGYSFCKATV